MEESWRNRVKWHHVWMLASAASSAAATWCVVDYVGSIDFWGQRPATVCDGAFLLVLAWSGVFVGWRRNRRFLPACSPKIGAYVVGIFLVIIGIAYNSGGIPPLQLRRGRVAVGRNYVKLEQAVKDGDTATVAALIARDGRADFDIDNGRALGSPCFLHEPLYTAVDVGNYAIAEQLLKAGASTSAGDGEALTLAARDGDPRMLRLLLAYGAAVNDSGGNSPALFAAVAYGREEVVSLLLSRGANPNSRDPRSRTDSSDTTGRLTVLQVAKRNRKVTIAAELGGAGAR